jgi:peptidyl-prolyl cis-trans isomerase A (cyclophilin A)
MASKNDGFTNMIIKKMIKGLSIASLTLAIAACSSQADEISTQGATNPDAPMTETPTTMEQAVELSLVQFKTNLGDFTVELNHTAAPETVENFLAYVNSGYYSDLVFHRVISGFMVQGGGFNAEFKKEQTRAPITLESNNGLGNKRGTIAMARTNVPNSATSQFFVNLVDNGFLDYSPQSPGYAVFGKITQGMDVVDAIAAVKTGNKNNMQNVPLEKVSIISANVITPSEK